MLEELKIYRLKNELIDFGDIYSFITFFLKSQLLPLQYIKNFSYNGNSKHSMIFVIHFELSIFSYFFLLF
jgi:hypothetical protein